MVSTIVTTTSSTRFVVVVLLPVIATAIWNILDANPALYFYDKAATITGGWQLSSLKGKTIWITGASSGIGAKLVCHVLHAGASHVILSSRNRDKLEQVAARCKEEAATNDAQVSIVPYDAFMKNSTNDTVDGALAAAAVRGGNNNIDILILNAGVYQSKPAMKTNREEREFVTRVNYQSPVDLTQSLLERGRWRERGYGHMVVVASVMSHGPHGLSSSYAASKAALRSYFQSLSTEEYASWGLRVDVACPGATDTSLWVNSLSSMADGTNNTLQSTNGGKMSPDRVAHLILTGVAGPHYLFYETWISKASGLLWIWLSHYMPNIFHGFVHLLGYIRVAVWEHEKLDAMDVPILLHRLGLLLLGKYP